MEENNDKNKTDFEKKCHNLELSLTFNNLNSIPEDVIQLKYLRSLNLSNNILTEIPNNIRNLKSLLFLDLSHNQLQSLPKSVAEISQLKFLNISNNKFTDVPPIFLESLQFLRILDLSHNEIKYFTDPPSCLANLVELNLSHNKLMKIPNWIFSIKCIIKNFDISHNKLICMNENFLSGNVLIKLVTKIQFLNLGNCGLSPDSLHFISNMTALEALKLSNHQTNNLTSRNYLDNLNFDIFEKCINLKHICLNYAEISFLPSDFACLKNLQYIDIEGNILTWLPDSFCDIESLKVCNLSRNLISFLPDQFGKLINLKEVYLNNNNLTEIPNSFNSLHNLEYCDFYKNKLEYINPSLIELKSLKGIDLEYNCLDFCSICGDEATYNQFTVKYSMLKEHYRKRINEKRCDLQILEKDDGSHGENDHSSESSEDELNSLLNTIDDKDNGSIEKWDEDWDAETSNIVTSELEHDDFDPNVNYDSTLRWKKTDEKKAFYSNFCPADNHIPSLRKYFLRKPQDVTVEGTQT